MRLLMWSDNGELALTDDVSEKIPPYSILSHTWGFDNDEVTFADIQQGRGQEKVGYQKLQFCGRQARKDGIKYFWVDTCCINKNNHVELSEAITSMFRWYRDAYKCYVYLADVSADRSNMNSDMPPAWEPDFRSSRWFTRGWTLQELLAPSVVEFFSCEARLLGTKETLKEQIHEVTTIPIAALQGTELSQFTIAERIRWTECRMTKKKEDKAYCLLGIFDVYMTFNYGEGDNAVLRLQKKINKQCGTNVAARLGQAQMSRNERLHQRLISPTVIDTFTNRASDSIQQVHMLQSEEAEFAGWVRKDPRGELWEPAASNLYAMGTINKHHDESPRQSPEEERIVNKELKYTTLLNSLLFERMDFRVNNAKKALLSTCQWLFRHPDFQKWHKNSGLDRHSGFLWIKGKPGCGKSTLMKAALDWARTQPLDSPERCSIVSYFFNARAPTSLEKSSLGLYRTVVHHLLSSCPPPPPPGQPPSRRPSLRTIFEKKFGRKNPGRAGVDWTSEELQDFLYDAVESDEPFRLYLFVDGLDEAEHEEETRQMISFLIQLSDRALATGGSCRVQICLSSRHYPHISVGRGLSLVVENQLEHSQDLETYITTQLTCPAGSEKDELQAEILNKSASIFLWVVLVVEILNRLDDRGEPLSDMRACLDTIPADLNELFREILTKGDQGVETSILFFQWMSYRMRPLEPAELFVALEYSKSSHGLTQSLAPQLSLPSPDRLARFILNCSRGLVEVVRDPKSSTLAVQFIHETVREFLLKDNGLASMVPGLAINLAGKSHEILRIACLRCISTTTIPKEYEYYCELSHKDHAEWEVFRHDVRRKLPFLDYAIEHLFNHAEEAQRHNMPQQMFLKRQIDTKGIWLNPYRQWWNILQLYKSKKVKHDATLIHFIVERRYSNLLPALLSVSNSIDSAYGDYKTVLHMASYHGFWEIVQILLVHGADVNVQGGLYGNALQAASARGHEDIVQMLLNEEVNVNAQGGRYGDALQAASACGYQGIVQRLLDRGAAVNTQGRGYGSALQAASACGHERIVRILLDRNADVNAQGGIFGNALQAALCGGHKRVVSILLQHGAK